MERKKPDAQARKELFPRLRVGLSERDHFAGVLPLSSLTLTTGELSRRAISADRSWAFLPSLVQPGITLTTLPPLSMRIFVGMAVASNVFHRSPLGSSSHRKRTPFLAV